MAFPVPAELRSQITALPAPTFGSLSPRLSLVASRVPEGVERLADVGADHGLLARELLARRTCRRVVAIDRSAAVVRALRDAGPWPRGMEVRLADGLAEEPPGSVDCAVLAGLGGRVVLAILGAAARGGHRVPSVIVQAQTEAELVAEELPALGYRSLGPAYVHEGGRIYRVEAFERRSGSAARPVPPPRPGQALLARAYELARERHRLRPGRPDVSGSPPA